MMKKTYLIGALALTLCACSGQPKEENGVIKVDIENAQPLKLTDFVKRITLVPLETNENSLIKNIKKLVMQDGKVYIQNDRQDVLVFDENGKFLLSTAKRRGQGPEDYIMLFSMDVTDDGLISIYDGLLIREYDLDLNLLSSYFPRLPESIHSAQEMRQHIKLNKDTYLLRDYQYTSIYSVSRDSVLEIRHELYHPYSIVAGVNSLRFLKQDEEIFFSPTFICDTLYQVNRENGRISPTVIYDAGDKDINLDDIADGMEASYYFEYMFKTDKSFLYDKVHLPNADFCYWANVSQNTGGVAYRSKDGKVTTYINSDNTAFPVPHAVYQGKLVYACMPEDVEKYMDSDLVDAESKERIKNLKEDDNQVLIVYELK